MDELRVPKVGDTVEVWDGRPDRSRATVIRGKVTAVHAGGLLDVEATRPINVGTREGDREGDKFTLTNQTPPDAGEFRAGQWRHA